MPKKYLTSKTREERIALNYLKDTCEEALDKCLNTGATSINDFVAAVEEISESKNLEVDIDINGNGITLNIPDYSDLGKLSRI